MVFHCANMAPLHLITTSRLSAFESLFWSLIFQDFLIAQIFSKERSSIFSHKTICCSPQPLSWVYMELETSSVRHTNSFVSYRHASLFNIHSETPDMFLSFKLNAHYSVIQTEAGVNLHIADNLIIYSQNRLQSIQTPNKVKLVVVFIITRNIVM